MHYRKRDSIYNIYIILKIMLMYTVLREDRRLEISDSYEFNIFCITFPATAI